jgi:hypothetical protein
MRGLCASDVPRLFIQVQFGNGMGCAVETTAGQRGSGRFDTPRPRVPPSGIPRVPCANCVRVHMSARPGSPPVGSGTPPLRSHRPAVVTSHANQLMDRRVPLSAASQTLPGTSPPRGTSNTCVHALVCGLRYGDIRRRASPARRRAPKSTTDSADTPAARISLYSTNGPTAAFSAVCTSVQPMTQVWTCPDEPVTSPLTSEVTPLAARRTFCGPRR